MVSFAQKNGLNQRPRLGRLMAVQEDIYRQVILLMPEEATLHNLLVSRVSGSPPLQLQILERHPYTFFIRLTYIFTESGSHIHNPNAHIRVYTDARIAEVTSFSWGQGIRRFASPYLPPRNVMLRSWRQNLALNKWLDYVLDQGHGVNTFEHGREQILEKQPRKLPILVEG